MELSMRQKYFCKIDQIQVVWEMWIFYYCAYNISCVFFGNSKLQEIIVETNLILSASIMCDTTQIKRVKFSTFISENKYKIL